MPRSHPQIDVKFSELLCALRDHGVAFSTRKILFTKFFLRNFLLTKIMTRAKQFSPQ